MTLSQIEKRAYGSYNRVLMCSVVVWCGVMCCGLVGVGSGVIWCGMM